MQVNTCVSNNIIHRSTAIMNTNNNWGEPERAPHLMMSTAVCMFVCRLSSFGKHLPEDELRVRVVALRVHSDNVITASA